MSRPKRIQRKRSKGWKMPPNTVYVGRPSKWGNPWTPENTIVTDGKTFPTWCEQLIGSPSRPATIDDCVKAYREDMEANTFGLNVKELRGKNLACWCPIGSPCHADVLLELANRRSQP